MDDQLKRGRSIAYNLENEMKNGGPNAADRLRATLSQADIAALEAFRIADMDNLVQQVEISDAGAKIRWEQAKEAYASRLARARTERRSSQREQATSPTSAKRASVSSPDPAHSSDFQRGFAAGMARIRTVVTSGHAKGNFQLAADLLQTDMTAEQITTILEKHPQANAAASAEDAAAHRILDAIEAQNIDLGTWCDGDGEAAVPKNHNWAKIHTEVAARRQAVSA